MTGDATPAPGPTAGRPPSPAGMADTGNAVPNDALWLLACRLASCGTCGEDLTGQARRLTERIAGARFHVAVIGEFKRGKSTLVNALLGRPVLPSGVVPLTAVATEVHFGGTRTTAVFTDGRRLEIPTDAIGDYVTERGNPSNTKGVDHVEIGLDADPDLAGLVLVDTPGIASVNEHNTIAAHAALADADGAVLVLSADSPLSTGELQMLESLADRHATTFVVINKADHLAAPDLAEVRAYVTDRVRQACGDEVDVYCVSARRALDRDAGTDDSAGDDFALFRGALVRFARDDLAAARRAAAVRELGSALGSALEIETAADSMSTHRLTEQLRRFEAAASTERRRFDEDRAVLDHEVAGLSSRMGQRLVDRATARGRALQPALVGPAATLARRELDVGLRREIERHVREQFEPLRQETLREVAAAWTDMANRFTARAHTRIDTLTATVDDLFDVHLPRGEVPTIDEQPDRFSYLFLHIESPNAVIGRWAGMLLPAGLARRRALRDAQRQLVSELDKHAGRAGSDLAARLDVVRARYVATMADEIERTETSLRAAVDGATRLLTMTEAQRRQRELVRGELRTLVAEIADFVTAELAREDGGIAGQSRSMPEKPSSSNVALPSGGDHAPSSPGDHRQARRLVTGR